MPKKKTNLSRTTSDARRKARYRAAESAFEREKRLAVIRLQKARVRAEMRLFNRRLEEDARNWMKYKIIGGSIKLKPGILPQNSKTGNGDPSSLDKPCKIEQTDEEYDGLLPHNEPCSHTGEYNIEIKHEPLSNIVKAEPPTTEHLIEEIFFQAVPDSNSEMFLDDLKTELEDPISDQIFQDNITRSRHESYSHKDIQCNINTWKHVRSKATQVDMNVLKCSRATSPIIFEK